MPICDGRHQADRCRHGSTGVVTREQRGHFPMNENPARLRRHPAPVSGKTP
jgi:hypothetical protein